MLDEISNKYNQIIREMYDRMAADFLKRYTIAITQISIEMKGHDPLGEEYQGAIRKVFSQYTQELADICINLVLTSAEVAHEKANGTFKPLTEADFDTLIDEMFGDEPETVETATSSKDVGKLLN